MFTNTPLPQLLVADFTDPNGGSLAALTANRIYFAPLSLFTSFTITQMRCWLSGAPTGNVDMGIYDTAGTNNTPLNLLGHTGAIAAVTGSFTQNLIANLTLSPGAYWICWLDTAADSVQKVGGVGAGIGPWYVSNDSFSVLPNPLTGGVGDTGNRPTILALRSGGYT